MSLSTLNSEQLAFVQSEAPKRFCIAGPGGGKTKTLTAAIERSLRRTNGQILAVTFTRMAAAELQSRMQAIRDLPDRWWMRLNTGTVHSVAYTLIRAFYGCAGYASDEIEIYDDTDRERLLDEMLLTERKRVSKTSIRRIIDKWSEGNQAPDDPQAEEVVRRYLRALLQRNAIDYACVLPTAIDMLQGGRARGPWDELYIDECQDLGLNQYRFFHLLGAKRIAYVGDPDQMIYSWRGADLQTTLDLGRAPDVEQHALTINYRSTPEIVAASQNVIRHNLKRVDRPARAERVAGAAVSVLHPDGFVPCVRSLMESGGVAVLARTHQVLNEAWGQLNAAGLNPVLCGKRMRLLERPSVRAIFSYLAWPMMKNSTAIFERVMLAERVQAYTQDDIRAKARSEGIRLFDASLEALPSLKQWYIENADCKSLVELVAVAVARIRSLQGDITNDEMDELGRMMSAFIRTTKFELRTPVELLRWISLRDEQDEARDDAKLQLMTIHGSKGLEFDSVVIVGLHDRVLPSMRSKTPEALEEERRLMYVAMTRARSNLVLLADPEMPSRFVAEALG